MLPFSEEGHQWTPHRTLPRRPNTPALPPFDSGVYAHLQDVTAEGPCFGKPCRSAPLSFWSRCRTSPSPRGGLVAFAICLCLRAGPRKKKQPGPGFENRPKITPRKKKAKNRTFALQKKKKGGVVESTLAFVPAFVCMLNFSLLTREPFPRF